MRTPSQYVLFPCNFKILKHCVGTCTFLPYRSLCPENGAISNEIPTYIFNSDAGQNSRGSKTINRKQN